MDTKKSDPVNLRNSIISLALRDSEFKKRLLANPELAIEETFGIQIPKDTEIKVLEDSNAQLQVEILNAKSGNEELSDVELSAISGGAPRGDPAIAYTPTSQTGVNKGAYMRDRIACMENDSPPKE